MTSGTLPTSPQAYVLQSGEGQPIQNLGLEVLATSAQTEGALLAATVTNPGPGGPPLHTHATIAELYFVLEGLYLFQIGDDQVSGGPGTFVYIPRGVPHTFASVGPDEGRMFFITLPGTEEFLRGISDLQARGFDQQAMVQHFRAFESEINGPPIA